MLIHFLFIHYNRNRSHLGSVLSHVDAQRVLLSSTQAYWRSCAALLGQVLETAFKEDFTVELLSTPEVPGRPAPLNVFRFKLVKQQSLTVGGKSVLHDEAATTLLFLLSPARVGVKARLCCKLLTFLSTSLFLFLQSLQGPSVATWSSTPSWTRGLPQRSVNLYN